MLNGSENLNHIIFLHQLADIKIVVPKTLIFNIQKIPFDLILFQFN